MGAFYGKYNVENDFDPIFFYKYFAFIVKECKEGNQLKKQVAVLTLCLFIISIFAGTAVAKNDKDNYGQLKKQNQSKWQSKHLVDIDDDWAKGDIEEALLKGFVKGYEDGSYQPNKPVTCLEVIIMLVRAAGLEDEVEDYQLSDNEEELLYKIPDWAKAYVAVALNEGILSEEEIKTFNPNQGAKRYQICVYMQNVVRNEYNLDADDEEFMVDFSDNNLIPVKARHSVKLMARFGVVNGYPDGSFGPNRVVKRNEVAKMLNYLDDNCIKNYDNYIKGTLEYIDFDDGTLTLDVEAADGEDWTFDIDEDDDVKIYYGGKLMPFDKYLDDDIETGGSIRVYVDDDDNPLLVKIYSPDSEIEILVGTLDDIDYYVDDDRLTLEAVDEDFDLEIYEDDNVDIYYDDDKVYFDEDLEDDIDTGGIIIALLNEDEEMEWVRIYSPDADYDILLGTLDDIDYYIDEDILTLEAIEEEFDLEIDETDDVDIYYQDEKMHFDEDLEEDIETDGIIVVLLDDGNPIWVRIYAPYED